MNTLEARYGDIVVQTEALPREAVDAVIINEQGKKMVDHHHRKYFDPDYIIKVACLSVFSSDESSPIATVAEEGRALRLENFEQPILYHGKYLASSFSQKGGNISGIFYADSDYFLGKNGTSSWGWNGYDHSYDVLQLTTDLLDNDFKTPEITAILVINGDYIRQCCLAGWRDASPAVKAQIELNLLKFEQREDIPALEFRLGGVPNRLMVIHGKKTTCFNNPIVYQSFRTGADILLQEMDLRPEFFGYMSEGAGVGYYKFLDILRGISEGIPFVESAWKTYAQGFSAGIGLSMLEAGYNLSPANRKSLEYFLGNSRENGAKDVDFSGMVYDFDITNSPPWTLEEGVPTWQNLLYHRFLERILP